MLTSHLAAAREEICDSYVLAHAGDGASLAKYLLSSAEKAAHVQLRFAVGLSWHDPLSLKRRITQLLAGDRNTMVRISSLATAAVVVSALIVSFFFTHANYASASLVVGMPINLGPVVNSAPWPDGDPELSADGLTLYFSTSRDTSGRRIAVSQRTTTNSPWTTPTIVPELNGTGANPWFRTSPTVTDDQLLMFFYASATVTVTNWDLYQSSRESVSAPWGRPVTVGAPVNSPFNDQIPGISGDGLTLYFSSDRQGTGGLDIYMAQRTTRSEPFGAPIRLGDEINSSGIDGGVDISSDGLLLVFHSTREPPEAQIFYSERASTSDPWSPAKRLTIGDETLVSRGNPSLSADQAQLYFTGRTGDGDVNTADLYVADIVPEPSTAALILAGCFVCALSTLLVLRKRQV
jgi:hypothetical protein